MERLLSPMMILFIIAGSVSHLARGDYRATGMNVLQTPFVLPTLFLAIVRHRRIHSILVPVFVTAFLLVFRRR